MRAGSAVESLASALYRALAQDLPSIEYTWRKPGSNKDGKGWEEETRTRRPDERDVKVFHFPETWGSTALGFGGIGGAAMTTAYTTVVMSGIDAAVYFDGMLAYVVESPNDQFIQDVAKHNMASVAESPKYAAKSAAARTPEQTPSPTRPSSRRTRA